MAPINYNTKKSSLFKGLSKQISTSINSILKRKALVTIALPGGRSISEVLSYLVTEKVDWTKVHIFMVDERIVPIESVDSNFKQLNDSFTKHLLEENKINPENVHSFVADSSKGDLGAGSYSHELNELGGTFDIVVLSAGEDGHIASLFPEHHSIEDGSEMFFTLQDSPKEPSSRLTASRKLINKSRVAILMFIDESKRTALEDYESVSKGVLSCPAKLVLNIPENYVYTNIKL